MPTRSAAFSRYATRKQHYEEAMSSSHHSTAWLMLDTLEEPTDGGRVLGVGGFVLADPFDTFLRQISAEYLQCFCDRINAAIQAFHLEVPDLSWGIIHCG